MLAASDGLVIFDCDGVLVDSEPISIAVLTETVRRAGGDIAIGDAYKRFLGRSVGAVVADLAAEYGLTITVSQLADMRRDLYERFRRELKAMDGVADVVEGIEWPLCVASSSQPERIRLSLDITGLREKFGTNIFSSSMVERGKPSPDLFLHAAKAMRVAPHRCIVIEDSPAGIVAARRAGMRVLAFTGGSHIAPAGLRPAIERLRPDAIFGSMSEVPWILERLGGRKKAS